MAEVKSSKPAKVKRPGNAFALYVKEQAKETRDAGETFAIESTKEMAAKWGHFTDEEKKPYVKAYAREMIDYLFAKSESELHKATKRKRSRSAFQEFQQKCFEHQDETLANLSFADKSREVATRFKNLSESEKAKYQKMATEHDRDDEAGQPEKKKAKIEKSSDAGSKKEKSPKKTTSGDSKKKSATTTTTAAAKTKKATKEKASDSKKTTTKKDDKPKTKAANGKDDKKAPAKKATTKKATTKKAASSSDSSSDSEPPKKKAKPGPKPGGEKKSKPGPKRMKPSAESSSSSSSSSESD